MRVLRAVAVTCVVLLAGLGIVSAQTWTPLTNGPSFSASNAYILPDGRVLVQDTGAQDWWALTPDITGSYQNGTWAQMKSMLGGYSPLYYASAILPDGRLAMLGGEYNFGTADWTNLGAIYTPKTNSWATLKAPSGWTTVGDAQSVILSNGTMMVANCCTTQEALLNAKTKTWTATGTGKADVNDEEGWTLLPSGKVLTVDANNNNTNSEIYDPATGSWTSAGSTIVQLEDPGSHEIGPAVLRPDGTVLATGGTGHNAVFDSNTLTWSQAPDFPKVSGKQLDIADGPAALLPDGNVLVMTSPGVFQAGVHFFEWDGTSFNAAPATPNSPSDTSYYGRMLVLPTGQIMLTDGSNDVELYNSTGSPNPSWAPTITKVPKTLTHGRTSTVHGTQLTGLSQGAAYGDDAQAASNYPLVRITNNATGHVFYARTHGFSSGVATGTTITLTHFDVPAGIELGASQLEVVTNGIASNPVSVNII
ncbi:MAG: hypothetical protein LAO30_22790 [Acidobacteriia bacterium]|nr:hypothetical protein [Terriglobia bacterium]